jgi:DNA-binding transcriptional LysR family regulator
MDELFSHKGLSLERLRSFLAVADAEGIARAAPGEPVRQSQLSRQIGELETALGVALTRRKGRSVVLTAAGLQLAAVARDAFKGLGEVVACARQQPSPLCLGAGESILSWWLIPALGALRVPEPRPRLTVTALGSAEIVGRLGDGRLELGLVRRTELPRTLRSRMVGEVDLAWFVPRRLHRGKDAAASLAEVPLAVTAGEPGELEYVHALARKLGVAPRIELICDTFPEAASAVRSGRYAAMLPSLAAKALRGADVVAVREPPLARRGVKLHLAWHLRLERRPETTGFVDALASALAKEAAG